MGLVQKASFAAYGLSAVHGAADHCAKAVPFQDEQRFPAICEMGATLSKNKTIARGSLL
jgi:hypothetical protein